MSIKTEHYHLCKGRMYVWTGCIRIVVWSNSTLSGHFIRYTCIIYPTKNRLVLIFPVWSFSVLFGPHWLQQIRSKSLLHWYRLLTPLVFQPVHSVRLLGGRQSEGHPLRSVLSWGFPLVSTLGLSVCCVTHTHTHSLPSFPPPPYPVFSDHLTGQLLYPSFHRGLLCLYPRFRKLLWRNHLFLFFQLFLLGYIHIVPFKTVMILI